MKNLINSKAFKMVCGVLIALVIVMAILYAIDYVTSYMAYLELKESLATVGITDVTFSYWD